MAGVGNGGGDAGGNGAGGDDAGHRAGGAQGTPAARVLWRGRTAAAAGRGGPAGGDDVGHRAGGAQGTPGARILQGGRPTAATERGGPAGGDDAGHWAGGAQGTPGAWVCREAGRRGRRKDVGRPAADFLRAITAGRAAAARAGPARGDGPAGIAGVKRGEAASGNRRRAWFLSLHSATPGVRRTAVRRPAAGRRRIRAIGGSRRGLRGG